jgi:hypothetical protein
MATGREREHDARSEDPGDPSRAQQEIEAQHRQLSAQLAECRSALAADPGSSASLERFRDLLESLEAHFVREESLYYPSIWVLRPALEQALKEVIESHSSLRQRLAAISHQIESGEGDAAARELEHFAELIAEHERIEEHLLASIG